MYEVGPEFIILLDLAILAIIAFVIGIALFIKKGQYAKEAVGKLRAEIQLPTGWSEFHIVPIDDNAKSVTVDNFIYMINPEKRRFGVHPLRPFMGLAWLQSPIRIETWFKDNPEPMRQAYDATIATSAEIHAITREIQATDAAMRIQEMDARQQQLENALANQPNKTIVYILLAVVAIIGIVNAAIIAQWAQLV